MNAKLNRLTGLIIISNIFFIAACANLKVIEKSSSKKPSWIYGIEKDYLTGEGIGKDYNEAKYNALQMVKEKIVSSVAQNISFEQNINVNETRYKRAIEFLEEYTSKTTSKAGNHAYLQGISLSKVSDYYWEKQRENRIETVYYYIKYPFYENDIQNLIHEWEEQERLLTDRLDTLKHTNGHYKSVEDIIEKINELKYLSDFFVDQRKASADISIKNLENKLKSIQIISEIDTLGRFEYNLMLGDNPISTIQKPSITSNCAGITEIVSDSSKGFISYNFINCQSENDNFFEINYSFEEWNLSRKIPFDVCSKKILIENASDISFTSINKPVFKKDHTIKCHITISSKSPISFTIDKIELNPQLCKRNCNRYYNYKSFPVIIIENINKSFTGLGNHSIEVIAAVPKSKTKQWASSNGLETKISGKIYYSSEITGEKKICKFSDVEYFTNW